MRNAGLEEAQAGIKIAGRNINHLRYADDTTLMAENEDLKSLLMKVKSESEFAQSCPTLRRQAAMDCNTEKPIEFQKNIYFFFIDYDKAFDCVNYNKLENSERDGDTRPPDLPFQKPICRSGSNHCRW